MKVVSKLANMTLTVGRLYREDNTLVVTNEGGEGLPTKVYVRPSDIFGAIGALLKSPSALGFFLLLPWHYFKDGGGDEGTSGLSAGKDLNNPWK